MVRFSRQCSVKREGRRELDSDTTAFALTYVKSELEDIAKQLRAAFNKGVGLDKLDMCELCVLEG